MDQTSGQEARWVDPPCERCGGWESHARGCSAGTRLKPSPACDVTQYPWCRGHRRRLSECYADIALRPGDKDG
jgi:hypothetical protein